MADIASIFGRHEFVVRRLHSLVGLLPAGAFLGLHLATNASILDGPQTFQARVDQIHSLGPLTLLLVEWCFILLPLLLHGAVGVVIVCRGKRNLMSYPYRENFRYTLQRATGVIAMAFILWHVFQTRDWFQFQWWVEHVSRPLGGGTFDPHNAARSAVAGMQAAWIMPVYVAGMLSTVYHFANGLWTMGITWGVWTGPRAQRWANLPCLLVGLALAAAGLGALVGLGIRS
ncbi:MAG: succinate dehydrogenase [Thermoguttaceae bacterium]|jgi:succinate dehydrogenase / fumarate reductase cytochrome b subunit